MIRPPPPFGACPLCHQQHDTTACPAPVYSYIQESSRTPHRCPVCNGHCKVSRPPWVAGDVAEWGGATTGLYDCQACSGTGIVWEPAR